MVPSIVILKQAAPIPPAPFPFQATFHFSQLLVVNSNERLQQITCIFLAQPYQSLALPSTISHRLPTLSSSHTGPMPAHRVFIETRAVDRSPRSPNPRSPRSPRHRPRTRSEERIYVYRDELPADNSNNNNNNTMTEHDRVLREAYDEAYRQNQNLRNELRAKELELQERDARIEELKFDNTNLRRSLDSLSNVEGLQEDEIHNLKRKNSKLRKDKDDLNVRVRELRHEMDAKIRPMVDQIHALKQEVANWRLQFESEKRKNNDLERRYGRLRENLDIHTQQSEAFRTQNENLRVENEQLAQVLELERRLRVARF